MLAADRGLMQVESHIPQYSERCAMEYGGLDKWEEGFRLTVSSPALRDNLRAMIEYILSLGEGRTVVQAQHVVSSTLQSSIYSPFGQKLPLL